jgi:hypothetical protein
MQETVLKIFRAKIQMKALHLRVKVFLFSRFTVFWFSNFLYLQDFQVFPKMREKREKTEKVEKPEFFLKVLLGKT